MESNQSMSVPYSQLSAKLRFLSSCHQSFIFNAATDKRTNNIRSTYRYASQTANVF